MANTGNKRAFIAAESAYGTDPSANGSGYAWIAGAQQLGEIPTGRELLETGFMTGFGFPTRREPGREGGQFNMAVTPIGLSSAAGDGVDASSVADDWYDNFWENHVTDTPVEITGAAVLSSAASTITFDAPHADLVLQNLIAVYDASLTALIRSQVALAVSGSGAGPWTVAPPWTTQPTAAAVAYGGKHYHWQSSTRGGSTQALHVVDDDVGGYTFLGCRIMSRKITAEIGKHFRDEITWGFETCRLDAAKSSLPVIGTAPVVTPLIALLSPVFFSGSMVETRKIEIEFGVNSQEVSATSGAQGRAGRDILSSKPIITIEPLRTDANRNLFRNGTVGRLLLQFGGGVLSGGALNLCAFHAEQAQVISADPSDDNGRARQVIQFEAQDAGNFPATSTRSRFWQWVRF